jgi:hypothetical protein
MNVLIALKRHALDPAPVVPGSVVIEIQPAV